MIQPPLAMNYAEALQMEQCLVQAGVPAMVNQNMTFVRPWRHAIKAIAQGCAVGQPVLAQLQQVCYFPTEAGHWLGKDERWWMVGLAVHEVSLLHLMFGPPNLVMARVGKDSAHPGIAHDGYGVVVLSYDSGLTVSLAFQRYLF